MADSETWPAGKYELLATSWDRITSKPLEPLDYTRHVQGDVVDLDVEHARRLGNAGAIVKPGEKEKAAAEQLRLAAEAAQAAYDRKLAELAPPPVAAEAPGTERAPGSTGQARPRSGSGS